MSDEVEELTSSLRDRLRVLIDVEADLELKLQEQEEALLKGNPERINKLNAALDEQLAELRANAEELKADTADLANALGMSDSPNLPKVISELPDSDMVDELMAMHTRLTRARRITRDASSKNAAIARTSLDAIASVRGILGRAMGISGDGSVKNPLSRLDTRA